MQAQSVNTKQERLKQNENILANILGQKVCRKLGDVLRGRDEFNALAGDEVSRSEAEWHGTLRASRPIAWKDQYTVAERSASRDEEDKCSCWKVFLLSIERSEEKKKRLLHFIQRMLGHAASQG